MRFVESVQPLAERTLRQIVTDGEQKANGGEELVMMIVEEEEVRLEKAAENGVAI